MSMTKEQIKADLAKVGYIARDDEALALAGTLSRQNGMRAILIEGEPGVGKTALGKAVAAWQGCDSLYYLCHNWSSDEELYMGINIPAVVAGKEDCQQEGILLSVIRRSQKGFVILVLDEIDKAPPRVDALLLDFLQKGEMNDGKLSVPGRENDLSGD